MQTNTSAAKFFPNIVLWGRDYVQSFLRTTVPTLLAPGNLSVLTQFAGSEFLIVCPDGERMQIETSPEYELLRQLLPVRFVPLDWDLKSKAQPILNLSEGHRRICQIVAKQSGVAIFLSPDCVVSTNAFSFLVDATRRGVQAVAAPGFRLIKEEVLPECKRRAKSGAVSLSGRELFSMFLRHHHAEMDGYFVDSQSFTRYPHYCFWPAKGHEAMLVRAFHLHPIMVRIPNGANLDTLSFDTIDGDFVGRVIGDFTKIVVVRDVDELVIFSLSPRSALAPEMVDHKYDPKHVATWAYCNNNKAIHRYYFTQPIIMRASEVDQTEMAQLVEQSGREAHDILSHPRPIQYVGFSHEFVPNETLSTVGTRDLIRELRRRLKAANWRQCLVGMRLLLKRV